MYHINSLGPQWSDACQDRFIKAITHDKHANHKAVSEQWLGLTLRDEPKVLLRVCLPLLCGVRTLWLN